MEERDCARLAPAGDQPEDKAVAYARNGTRMAHAEILGVNPGGIGGAGLGV